MDRPLISCVMLTMPGREAMADEARRCFQRQTWLPRELIVIAGPGSIGQKRNRGNGWAAGEIICHWDDDDWSAPGRLADQAERLMGGNFDMSAYHSMIFADPDTREAWRYCGTAKYAVGTSMMYWRRFWMNRPFLDTNCAEDNAFLYGDPDHDRAPARVTSVDGTDFVMARIHPGNTLDKREQIKRSGQASWVAVPWSDVDAFWGETWNL